MTQIGDFSNFGSLKSTETDAAALGGIRIGNFSNFGSLKSTETRVGVLREGEQLRISAISAR